MILAFTLAILQQIPPLDVNAGKQSPLQFTVDDVETGKPIFEESFATARNGRSVTQFATWQVSSGTVDVVVGKVPGSFGSFETNYVNLGGSTGQSGTLETTNPIIFLPGVKYAVNFSYNSSQGSQQALVKIGDESFRIATNSKAFRRETRTFVFAKATQAKLVFQGLGDGRGGIGIGNVSVVPLAAQEIP